jgi:hypothetical protein
VGPSLSVEGGKLRAAGRELLELPAAQWVHFEVAAAIGGPRAAPGGPGTWDLTVSLPGAAPRHFVGLPNGSARFRALTWLGFSSMANAKAVFYLDNLALANSPE